MIIERREYRLLPGCRERFWALQRDHHWPPEGGDYFGRLVGYFETRDELGTRLIHLYRYDDAVLATDVTPLRLGPFPRLRPMVEPFDRAGFDARDPADRVLAAWPAPPPDFA